MENTKESPGPFDCFASAKPNEPIFTLQGGDPLAAPLVLAWARDARTMGLGLSTRDNAVERSKGNALLLRATEAESVAWAMQDYYAGRTEEELEEEAKAEVLPEVETREQVNEHRERLAASRAVSNSVAECIKAAETSDRFELATASSVLRTSADALKRVADTLRGPYRG